MHRFPNGAVRLPDGLHWDILGLYARRPRRAAGRRPRPRSGSPGSAIDSWAVDYGLLDRRGALLGQPAHYRDAAHRDR